MAERMNEQVLDTLANVAITLGAFSGVVVAFRVRGAHTWSALELRALWSWGLCSALLGFWFLVGGSLALWGELRDRAARRWTSVPLVTPVLYGI